jgi:hypothetical protein
LKKSGQNIENLQDTSKQYNVLWKYLKEKRNRKEKGEYLQKQWLNNSQM